MFGLFRLGYLFYPWGFIVQVVALVHFFRRRPDGFWLWVIFFGGFLGALVYICLLYTSTALLVLQIAERRRKANQNVIIACLLYTSRCV